VGGREKKENPENSHQLMSSVEIGW